MDWNCLINIRSSLLSGQGKLQCLLLGIHWTQLSSCITRDTNQEWNNAPIIFFILASCRNIANVNIAKMIFKNELKTLLRTYFILRILDLLKIIVLLFFYLCSAMSTENERTEARIHDTDTRIRSKSSELAQVENRFTNQKNELVNLTFQVVFWIIF